MRILIERNYLGPTSCIGECTIFGDPDGDGAEQVLYKCKTLENKIEASKLDEKGHYLRNQDDRVKEGEYKLGRHDAKYTEEDLKAGRIPKGKKVGDFVSSFATRVGKAMGIEQEAPIVLYNDTVPKSRWILFHAGNTEVDSKACILLGETALEDSISNSRVAVGKFYNIFKGNDMKHVTLTIVNKY